MGRHLASLFYAAALGGCSLIYSPSNLPEQRADAAPPIDAAIDAPIADANPSLLMLSEVTSPPLLEGQGDGGSAPAILVIYGMNITKAATITVEPTTPDANVVLELGAQSIADDGNSIAVLVSAMVMPMVPDGAAIPLTVTVTQPGADPKTIEWSLQPLDELTTAGSQAVPPANKLFSRVLVDGDVAFTAGPDRAIVRAVANIAISGAVTANASGQTAGAGGCGGGASSTNGACFGGGKSQGGGGGYGTPGTAGAAGTAGAVSGDEFVRSYVATGAGENRGGGGAGGAAVGGGGGGSIELTAGGHVEVGSVQANGGDGADAGIGRGGGGGAGGLVLLRAGAMLAFPSAVDVDGGTGGNAGILASAGGNGGLGRVRFDAAQLTGSLTTQPDPRRGPMLERPANPIFEITQPVLKIIGASGDRVDVIVVYPDGSSQTIAGHLLTGASTPVQPTLGIGHNKVCVLVPGGTFGRDEAQNCISAVFVP